MTAICIGKEYYKVEFVPSDRIEGDCGEAKDAIEGYGGKILINQDIKGERLIDTFCHEVLHRIYPFLVEDEISKGGTTMARCLIDMGFVLIADEEDDDWTE